jgi:hypothetical protein
MLTLVGNAAPWHINNQTGLNVRHFLLLKRHAKKRFA